MKKEIITNLTITMDDGELLNAEIYLDEYGFYHKQIDYNHKPNGNVARRKNVVDNLFISQHRDWFRFIRFQKSSTPVKMPTITKTKTN
jgi:hypothetical protein